MWTGKAESGPHSEFNLRKRVNVFFKDHSKGNSITGVTLSPLPRTGPIEWPFETGGLRANFVCTWLNIGETVPTLIAGIQDSRTTCGGIYLRDFRVGHDRIIKGKRRDTVVAVLGP